MISYVGLIGCRDLSNKSNGILIRNSMQGFIKGIKSLDSLPLSHIT